MDANAIGANGYVGTADTVHEQVYTARGLPFVAEFYADLDYTADGRIIITREHEAIDPEAAAARTLRAVTEGRVEAVDGIDGCHRAGVYRVDGAGANGRWTVTQVDLTSNHKAGTHLPCPLPQRRRGTRN